MIPAPQVRMWTRREGRDAVSISRRLYGSKTLVYDDDNRLTSLTSGGVTDLYYYKYTGERYRARLSGIYYRYLYNGGRVLEELNDSGTMQARYTTENDSYYGQWLHLYRPSGTLSRFPMYDSIGSARGLLDASGTATDWYELDTFGRQVSSTGTTPNPHRFGAAWGYITDPSGLLQLGQRFYWPEVGRFVSQDPIKDGRNWYGYAGNSPLAGIDPSGRINLRGVRKWIGRHLPYKRMMDDAGDFFPKNDKKQHCYVACMIVKRDPLGRWSGQLDAYWGQRGWELIGPGSDSGEDTNAADIGAFECGSERCKGKGSRQQDSDQCKECCDRQRFPDTAM